MARAIPRVDDGVLYPTERAAAPIRLDAPAWYAWLEEHTSFSFATPSGAVTIRKERGRPSGWYWKAYHRVGGKLRTAYLGRSADLSLARLHAAVATLSRPPAPPAPRHAAAPDARPPEDPEALLHTKFFMPRPRAQRVLRRRLLDRLRGDPLPPVVLVAAPAGYGKSTLVADWIAGDDRAAAWLSLDPGDNDPGAFWTAAATALNTLHPEAGARALQLLRNPQPPPLAGILTILINDLTTHLRPDAAGRPALLILDDYHLITERAIHETVISLITYLPPHLRLVLTSRADPPLRLGRLRVRGQVLEIRTDELAFDGAETAAFLRDTMGLALPEGAAAALATRTEGWAAALQLAALSLRTQPDPAAFIAGFSGSHRPLLAYLFDEVVNQQPAAHQDFLLATAVLDQMCAGLCAAVLDSPDPGLGRSEAGGQALLEELEAENLFVVALDTTGHWYRYHRLFAETLRHRLRQHDPAGEREYRRRAAAWYAQAGYGPEAIAQALAGHDWDTAAGLIAQFAEETRRHGELERLAGWLDALPPSLLHDDPHLALLKALVLLYENQYAAVEPWLQDVERGLAGAPGDSPAGASADPLALAPHRGRVAVIHAQVERVLRNDLRQSRAHAQTALAALPADDVEWRTMALLNLATVAYFGDDLENAVRYYGEAGALSARGGFHLLTCIIGSRGSTLLYDLGRLGAAQTLCTETRRLVAGAAGADLPGICQIDWAEAMLCYEASDLSGAERLLRRAIALAAQGRQLEIQGFAYLTRSQVCLAQGDYAGALQAIAAAAGILAPPQTGATIYQRILAGWQATVLLARSAAGADPHQAGQEVAPVFPLGEPWTELPDPAISFAHWLFRPWHLLPARARLAQGDPAGALAYLEGCCTQAEARGALTLLIAALALQAVVLAQLGRRAPARTALLRALTLGAGQGHVRSILDAGPGLAPLLHALTQDLTRSPDTSPPFLAYVYGLREAAGPDAAPPLAPAAPLSSGPAVILNSRERAILRLLEAGCSNQEIADQLILGVSTVKWYLRAIYEKLGTGNRTQAVARARALRLLP